ncbi:MAG: Eco57I restriction-modification methylase domain-containing protein [Lactobacillales bacterium]|jgi:site-specific DNA-methyltransferase (adenine-specific)|nr:Eco57I restriction-modification methylase domain-containing protein [Lactobacillales bacterium]
MSEKFLNNNYNPDVLSCLANLSNDEVFTPPEVANKMLDMLPQELFSDPNAKFLDPCAKSGVFLREIAKRLIEGLKNEIPNLQERIDHIFQKQLYAIAITELTSLLSRRSVYCSKFANCKYSVSKFENVEGNIRFKRVEHKWNSEGKCIYCGASKKVYDRGNELESHAYELIHNDKPKEIFDMQFDVIIGNPPYQLSDGGAQASATPIYQKFVDTAKNLSPRYLTMITPSRWFSGGKGLDSFRDEMLHDRRLRKIVDYMDESVIFDGVVIKGGVSYFLWNRDNPGIAEIETHEPSGIINKSERELLENGVDIFIRHGEAISIYEKVASLLEPTMDSIVSSRKPFGLRKDFNDFKKEPFTNSLKIFVNKKSGGEGYVRENQLIRNVDWAYKWKVFVTVSTGDGKIESDKHKPIFGEPGTVSSETYLLIGPFETEVEAVNCEKYINTKFFHFLLGLRKVTQDATAKVYSFIPQQNFSEEWNDAKLFAKYDLNDEEINVVNRLVWPDVTESGEGYE